MSDRIAKTADHTIKAVHHRFMLRTGVVAVAVMKQSNPADLMNFEIARTSNPIRALEDHWKEIDQRENEQQSELQNTN
ncbi:hypothetical protein BST61_g11361 [Cercospora zeina]